MGEILKRILAFMVKKGFTCQIGIWGSLGLAAQ